MIHTKSGAAALSIASNAGDWAVFLIEVKAYWNLPGTPCRSTSVSITITLNSGITTFLWQAVNQTLPRSVKTIITLFIVGFLSVLFIIPKREKP